MSPLQVMLSLCGDESWPRFEPALFSSSTAGAGGILTGEVLQTVNYGEDGTAVEAIPNTGYHFVKWSDGSTANPRTDTGVTADVEVTATFSQNEYTLTINPLSGGSITADPCL